MVYSKKETIEALKKYRDVQRIVNESGMIEERVIDYLTDFYEEDQEIANFLEGYFNQYQIPENKTMVISDTHLGGQYENYLYLYKAYELAYNQGVRTVIHLGDLLEGDSNKQATKRRVRSQIEEVIKNYPRAEDVKTYYLKGNHDYLLWDDGILILRECLSERKDLVCVGSFKSFMNWHQHRMLLFHCNKYARRIPDYPYDMELCGHSHYYRTYDNENILKVPTLSDDLKGYYQNRPGFILLTESSDAYFSELYNFDSNGNPTKTEEKSFVYQR